MTISAVNSYSYSASLQYQYFGTSVSNNDIRELLDQYGISPTGDDANDLKTLYEAMYPSANSVATSQVNEYNKAQQKNKAGSVANAVPWANLMEQAGLKVTGDLTTDYSVFQTKINAMKSSASSPQDKAIIYQLEAEATIVFSSAGQPVKETIQSRDLTGADIQAELNKAFFMDVNRVIFK